MTPDAMLREVRAIRQLLTERLPVPASVVPVGLDAFLLDPFELRIVRAVAAGEPMALKTVARRTHQLGTGGRSKTRLRSVLAGLVRRQILIGERDGYRVNPALRQLVPHLLADK